MLRKKCRLGEDSFRQLRDKNTKSENDLNSSRARSQFLAGTTRSRATRFMAVRFARMQFDREMR